MADTITEAVRKQYEAYSYPPPIEDAAQFLKQWGPLTCDPGFAGIQLWPEGRPRQDLRILCAGCGSSQPEAGQPESGATTAEDDDGCHFDGGKGADRFCRAAG